METKHQALVVVRTTAFVVAGVAALWIAHLFPKGDRPAGWTDRVRSTLHASARQVAASFADVGHGLVQAPPS